MSDLETAFYIISIIFMSLALVLTIGIAVALVVIHKKLSAIHDKVETKLHTISDIAHKGATVMGAIKKVSRVAKR
jgi:hypothetical protein